MIRPQTNPTTSQLREFLAQIPPLDPQVVSQAESALTAEATDPSDLDLIISMIDLTTLEGTDTPQRVRDLVATAVRPIANEPLLHTAAVCVYGDMAATAREALGADNAVQLACVAGAFPSGRADISVKVADVAFAVAAGADEIDIVIDRGAFLAGDLAKVFDDIVQMKAACVRADGTRAHLKVILENSELGSPQNVHDASWLAMAAGADFIKTSTGKVAGAATLRDVAIMLRAVVEWRDETGELVGVKPAGGIRAASEALEYLQLVRRVAGQTWLTPSLFRFGASSLLSSVIAAREKFVASGAFNEGRA